MLQDLGDQTTITLVTSTTSTATTVVGFCFLADLNLLLATF